MPGKKLKKGKKSKGGKGKKKKKGLKKKKGATKEYLPNQFDIPAFEDPKIWTPIVNLTVKLILHQLNELQFNLKVPTTTRVMTLKDKIM